MNNIKFEYVLVTTEASLSRIPNHAPLGWRSVESYIFINRSTFSLSFVIKQLSSNWTLEIFEKLKKTATGTTCLLREVHEYGGSYLKSNKRLHEVRRCLEG
jgi:hypothetical protein